MIDGLFLTKEKIIKLDSGDVMHAIKENSNGFFKFGEAYFSIVEYNSIKAWKRHKKMHLNLVVPFGKVLFAIFDDRRKSNKFAEYILSNENYFRLTIPPNVWVGFKGLSQPKSIILNIADIPHDDKEVEKIRIDDIEYDWKSKK